jgi:hypothetical protein
MLVHSIQDAFKRTCLDSADVWPRTQEYLRTAPLEQVPSLRICAALFAAMAEQAAAGRRRGPNRGTATDVNVISSHLPYCDAIFVDKEHWNFLQHSKVRDLVRWPSKVFCYSNGEEFLGYLEELRSGVSEAHVNRVREVYGRNWERPYTTMYDCEEGT